MERIAMMAAWNTDSGVAIHAEPIGKEWINMGYELKVFTFLKNDYHGEEITSEDEDYVIRCFGISTGTNFLDPRPIITADYDFFVIEDLGMLPKEKLAPIFPIIKRKAKTIHIVHDTAPSSEPAFYNFDWDAVIYFDTRQEKFLKSIYGDIAHYIPFPCFPLRRGNKAEARKKLGLPLKQKIVIVFCRRGYLPYLPELAAPDLKDVLFLILTNRDINERYAQTEIRKEEFFSHSLFDDYLFAADAIMLHKISASPQEIGILSSTIFQCLGAGCPILAPRISDFIWPFQKEILRYSDRNELRTELLNVFNKGKKYKDTKTSAKKFVSERSPKRIAKQFIDLFHSL